MFPVPLLWTPPLVTVPKIYTPMDLVMVMLMWMFANVIYSGNLIWPSDLPHCQISHIVGYYTVAYFFPFLLLMLDFSTHSATSFCFSELFLTSEYFRSWSPLVRVQLMTPCFTREANTSWTKGQLMFHWTYNLPFPVAASCLEIIQLNLKFLRSYLVLCALRRCRLIPGRKLEQCWTPVILISISSFASYSNSPDLLWIPQ